MTSLTDPSVRHVCLMSDNVVLVSLYDSPSLLVKLQSDVTEHQSSNYTTKYKFLSLRGLPNKRGDTSHTTLHHIPASIL